jgi:iron complex outermembrane receptor protein
VKVGMNCGRMALRNATILASGIAALMAPQAVLAQTSDQGGDEGAPARPAYASAGDIIVSARKQQESILKVPVVVTALSGETIQKLGVTEMLDLPRLVPGLNLARGNLSAGIFVTIRGIGTSQMDPSLDQSVSLNIDGLALTQGLAFTSGMFDLGQIEVLKGPQALFYGKSSPGGVIALRSADPTDELEVIGRAGYEFEANERRAELIVSGPLSDTLKARLAGNYSAARGYFRHVGQVVPGTGAKDTPYSHDSRSRSYHIRGTLLWNPTDRFSARFKANLVRDHIIRPEAYQLKNCPDGPDQTVPPANIPFIANDDCTLNRTVAAVDVDPAFFPGVINDGVGFGRTKQRYGSLELNYDLTPDLSLNSTTAYYRMRSRSLFNAHGASGAGPVLAAANRFGRRDFTQELRLASDFAGPLNFIAGGFYQDAWLLDGVQIQGNRAYVLFPGGPNLGVLDADGQTIVDTKVYSLFGQLRWQLVDQLELAGGVRWTDETKRQRPFNFVTNQPVIAARDRISFNNLAPEVTLTYTPTDDLTVFAAYKQAYKSGSFSVGTPPLPGADNSFDDEKVRGGELGVKSRLLDRQLTANIAAYYYKYTGLQVGGIQPPEPGQLPIIRVINAGAARTYGIDFDAAYRPNAVEGLEITTSVNWNNGKYTDLQGVPCTSGQTIAAGCNTILNPQTGLFTAQDLSGTPLIRAPRWQATLGFSYEMPVASDYKLVLSNSNQVSSRFMTFLGINRPDNDNFQKGFIKSDVSVALRGPEDRWELAVIGKNINDKITSGLCSSGNFAGGLFLTQQFTGGTDPGLAGVGEASCYVERGRSVWLRLTLRPFS